MLLECVTGGMGGSSNAHLPVAIFCLAEANAT